MKLAGSARQRVGEPARAKGEVYLCATPVELYSFDSRYIELLRRHDDATREHFVSYFTPLLRIKLRSRKLPVHVVHDLTQETFSRVLQAVHTEEVRQPERFGAFVNSVCKNVMQEHYRLSHREQHEDVDEIDMQDKAADLEAQVITEEREQRFRAVLKQLSPRDRTLVRAVLTDRNKDELCRELGIDRGYLRVLLHRAIAIFKQRYRGKDDPGGSSLGAREINHR